MIELFGVKSVSITDVVVEVAVCVVEVFMDEELRDTELLLSLNVCLIDGILPQKYWQFIEFSLSAENKWEERDV